MKNDAGIKARQQIIDKIKNTNNILVTVSRDPSVDELSAALGLTAILNKMGKHGTAIFSGQIPPAISFLSPENTFESTADSLRDFIIALDKEKADHLRYKIDGDVVKIFITPYHATITSDDLNFSQGDYNVELVIALGVTNKEHLDTAISAHGQILHDADIMTLSFGENSSRLGSVDWQDGNASCLCEMVSNISGSLKTDKPLLDKQISTALLTGIVAATDRFSNMFTSSRVMTVAAQLMAVGADPQLVAAKLQEAHEIDQLADNPSDVIVEQPDVEAPVEELIEEAEPEVESNLPPGSLVVDHASDEIDKEAEELARIQKRVVRREPIVNSISAPFLNRDNEIIAEVEMPDSTPESAVPPVEPQIEVPTSTLPPEEEEAVVTEESAPEEVQTPVGITQPQEEYQQPQAPVFESRGEYQNSPVEAEITSGPSFGGVLNATTDQAEEDARRDLENDQNRTILAHSYLGNAEPEAPSPINSSIQGADNQEDVDIFQNSQAPVIQPPLQDLPMPPEVPDFSTLPPQPQAQYVAGPQSPYAQPMQNPYQNQPSNDPGQFRIPGQ